MIALFTSIASIISTIVMVVEIAWKILVLSTEVIASVFKFAVTAINWSVNIVSFLFTFVRSALTWFAGWMGPLATSVKWALSPEELQRVFTLASGFAAVLWVIFSTVFNDAFYLLINPFFYNVFTTIGHFGFSLVAGAVVFVWDAIRRLFHGQTKQQMELIRSWHPGL